jgi:hypothetical protein
MFMVGVGDLGRIGRGEMEVERPSHGTSPHA